MPSEHGGPTPKPDEPGRRPAGCCRRRWWPSRRCTPPIGRGGELAGLGQAAAKAREADAVLLACTVDRCARGKFGKSAAGPDELGLLDYLTEAAGVQLVTWLDPNATASQQSGCLTKIGQRVTGKRGGRPKVKRPGHMKQLRLKNQKAALAMLAKGQSVRDVSRELGVPRATLQDWKKKRGTATE